MKAKQWYLLAYDVRDDRRLQRIGAFVGGCALRLQRSVYLLRADDDYLDRVILEVRKRADVARDDIRLYPVTRPDTIWAAGIQTTVFAGLHTPASAPDVGAMRAIVRKLFGKHLL